MVGSTSSTILEGITTAVLWKPTIQTSMPRSGLGKSVTTVMVVVIATTKACGTSDFAHASVWEDLSASERGRSAKNVPQ